MQLMGCISTTLVSEYGYVIWSRLQRDAGILEQRRSLRVTRTITPFLMFTGQAEAAMNLYASIFPDAEIEQIERNPAGEGEAQGTITRALFRLQNQRFMCIDSPDVHAFSFTPAISLFVDFDSVAELERAFEQLAEDGQVLMPLDAYPFSSRFAWINDRFGVSWQLNLLEG